MSSLSPRTVIHYRVLLLSSLACCSKFTRGELIQILGVVVDAATFSPRVLITIGKESDAATADHFDYFIITRDLLLCSWTVSVCVFLLWKSGRVEEQPKQQPKRCRRQTQVATGFFPHVNHSGRLSRQQQQRNTSQTRSLLSPAHPST